jgi:hemerythrin-like metal-binding protein
MTNTDQSHIAYEENEQSIPDEHKEIAEQISIVRSLASNSPSDVKQIISALQGLLEMTISHFRHEEAIMVIDHFPGTLLHKRDHDYLVNGLEEFAASLDDKSVLVGPEIGDNLQSWLRFHIKKFDDAYLEFKARSDGLES